MISDLILKKLDAASNSEIYDIEHGDFVYETATTRDTLEDFKQSCGHWAECERPFKGVLGEFPYIGWSNVQAKQGDMRNPMTIIDLGDCRISIQHDVRELS